jgi:hypothetical protein
LGNFGYSERTNSIDGGSGCRPRYQLSRLACDELSRVEAAATDELSIRTPDKQMGKYWALVFDGTMIIFFQQKNELRPGFFRIDCRLAIIQGFKVHVLENQECLQCLKQKIMMWLFWEPVQPVCKPPFTRPAGRSPFL